MGTMRNETHGANVDDCYPCEGGKYCDVLAAKGPTGICLAGYYCPSTDDIGDPRPSTHRCPTGFYCLDDTADPIPCQPGTYQPSEQETTCLECPAGHYCPQNTTIPIDCPIYSFCPNGSAEPTLCLNGTYNDASTTLEKPEDCSACTAGMLLLTMILY